MMGICRTTVVAMTMLGGLFIARAEAQAVAVDCVATAFASVSNEPLPAGAPLSLTVDAAGHPSVLMNSSGWTATVADRDATGQWSSTPLPFDVVAGTLVTGPDGDQHVLAESDGPPAFSAVYARRHAGVWGAPETVQVEAWGSDGELAVDASGNIWAALVFASDEKAHIGTRGPSGWSFTAPLAAGDERIRLALSPRGEPNLLGWSWLGSSWSLSWSAAPFSTVEAVSPPETETSNGPLLLAVSEDGTATGQPHVFYSDPARSNIYYATRKAGAWSTELVASAPPSIETPCTPEPIEGDICVQEGASYSPLALTLDRSGAPLFIYSVDQSVLTETWSCKDTHCGWNLADQKVVGRVELASACGGSFTASPIDQNPADGVLAAVDSFGQLHLIESKDSSSRYLSFVR